MKFLNSAVQIAVVAFVFIAGAITLAGPDSSVTQNDVAINSTAPAQQDNDAAAESAIPVVEESDLAKSKKAEALVDLRANSG